MYIYIYICLSIYLTIYLYICLSIYPSNSLYYSIFISTHIKNTLCTVRSHGTKAPYSKSFVTRSNRSFATASLMATCPCSSALLGFALPGEKGPRFSISRKKRVNLWISWLIESLADMWASCHMFPYVSICFQHSVTVNLPSNPSHPELVPSDLSEAAPPPRRGHSSPPNGAAGSWSSPPPWGWRLYPIAASAKWQFLWHSIGIIGNQLRLTIYAAFASGILGILFI